MSYIGAFDSGLGGLSIFRALHQHLPKARFTFLADGKHFPYGEKSQEVLHPIFNNNVNLFQDSKGIVVACNTMSCFIDIEKNHKPPIFSIIDCMVTTVQKYYKDIGALGIMGTDYTVRSETYLNYFKRIGHSYPIYQVAGTKLAPAVENDDENVWEICKSYIDQFPDNMTHLLLGCTHYNLLYEDIQAHYPHLTVIDPYREICQRVDSVVQKEDETEGNPLRFLTTKYTSNLQKKSDEILQQSVHWEEINL